MGSSLSDLETHLGIEGIRVIPTIGDGSCFFHAVLQAFNLEYIRSRSDRRQEMARLTRNLLAEALEELDPETGKTYYEGLGKGHLADLGKTYPPLSLPELKKLLRSSRPVGHEFLEALGNFFNLDICVLRASTDDVYVFEAEPPLSPGRPTVFILYTQGGIDSGHYETIGLQTSSGLKTLFAPNHPLPQAYRRRYRQVVQSAKS